VCVWQNTHTHTHTRRYRLTKQAAFPSFFITSYSAASHNDIIILEKKNSNSNLSLETLQFCTIPNPHNGKWGIISTELRNTLSVGVF